MGKKRIATKGGDSNEVSASSKKVSKRKLDSGILHVQSTFNNSRLVLTDEKGNVIASASSGGLGFKGAKKGTPYAAAKAGEVLAEKAEALGLKRINIIIKGVGSGRESSIRSFVSRGVQIESIIDRTPVPHNGPKPKKARRV